MEWNGLADDEDEKELGKRDDVVVKDWNKEEGNEEEEEWEM